MTEQQQKTDALILLNDNFSIMNAFVVNQVMQLSTNDAYWEYDITEGKVSVIWTPEHFLLSIYDGEEEYRYPIIYDTKLNIFKIKE